MGFRAFASIWYPALTDLPVPPLRASVTTPLNQSSIGAGVGVHHDVVGRHLDSLRDAYLLWSVQQLDHEWIGLPRAMAKVYPVDPLIGRLAHLRSSSRGDLDLTVLAESQIGMAMQRAHLATGADWAGERPLFYLRTPTRKEVDFVGEALAGAAVEGKYTEGGRWSREAATVNASRHRGILTTRNVLDTTAGARGAWAVPACTLAVLIDAQPGG